MTHVAILGAGPAGLAAALELAERGLEVDVFEQREVVGGNAGSFDFDGMRVDYGSHRLHPAADAEVLSRLRGLLASDLLARPRHGRIRLLGRWIHFPLRPLDLLLRVHPRFALGVGVDLLRKALPVRSETRAETFASILEAGLGRTVCEEFYFPYARKIWGLDPVEISPTQAQKRISANSIGKMLRRLLPGGTGSGAGSSRGIFFYPRHGYGQISDALHQAACEAGARVHLGAQIRRVTLEGGRGQVEVEHSGRSHEISARQVYSTIPITVLARLIHPGAPAAVLEAAGNLEFRSMLLVYLALEQERFSEFDAHYFPELEFPFSRVSEPKNYAASGEPEGRTALCAEFPCARDDALWRHSDSELADLVCEGLGRAGLPIQSAVRAVEVRRIPFAYPLYRTGFEKWFERVDDWIGGLKGVLSFGRQGLYAHDNTHHAIYMAQAAARSLRDDGSIDTRSWQAERRIFETHVVED